MLLPKGKNKSQYGSFQLTQFRVCKALFAFCIALTLTACTAKQSDLENLTGAPALNYSNTGTGGTASSGNSITQFSILSGNYQTTALGSPVAQPLKVALLTSAGLPDVGKTVFFTVVGGASYGTTSATSAVTGADGIAQVTYTAGTQTGTIAVTASTAGQTSLNFSVTVNGVSVYDIQKAPTANGNAQSAAIGSNLPLPFKVIVTDISTNSVVPNVTVRFLANQGVVSGSFSGSTYVDILTDANGIATSPVMTLNTTAGSHTARALIAGDPTRYTDFSATAVVPSNSSIDTDLTKLTLSDTSVVANGSNVVTAKIEVKDQYGNFIPNNSLPIAFTTTPSTSGNLIGTLAVWDSSSWSYSTTGTFTRTFTVNTTAGNIVFTAASVNGSALTSTLPSVAVTASTQVVPANSDIVATSASMTANGVSTANIIVTLNDSFHNQVSNNSHTVVVSASAGTLLSTTLSYHPSSGTYRTVYTSPTSVGAGSATVTLVSVDGVNVSSKTASITLLPGPVTQLVASGGTGQSAAYGNILPTAFSVTAKDANNNIVPSVQVDWSVIAGGGSLSSASNTTNASGVSSSTLTLGNSPVVNTVQATLHSDSAVYTQISATATTTSYTASFPFDDGTSASYVPSTGSWATSTLEIVGGVCRLKASDQTDSATHYSADGTKNGLVYAALSDGTNGLKLGSDGSCNGSTTACAQVNASDFYELNSGWTPQWNSIVAYWKMNNNWNDSKGSLNGTAYNSPTFTAGTRLGSHVGTFNGSNQYVSFGNNNTMSMGAHDLTVSAWFKTSVNDGTLVCRSYYGPSVGRWCLGVGGSVGGAGGTVGVLFENAAGGGITFSSTGTYKDDSWHLATMVVKRTDKITLYVDGTSVATSSSIAASSGADLTNTLTTLIGVYNDNSTNGAGPQGSYFNGSIDDVAIWSIALTEDEVQKIYFRQSAKYSGVYTSRVMDAFGSQSWTDFSWTTTLPFFKNLPNYASGAIQNETHTDYTSLNTDTLMNNIVGLWHFDESSGTTFANSSGVANLTASAGSTTVVGAVGKLGNGIRIDGTSTGMVTVPYNSSVDITGSVTYAAWAKFKDTSSILGIISNMSSVSNYRGFGMLGINGKADCLFGKTAASIDVASVVSVGDGQWHHIVCVYNGTQIKVYVDGILSNSTNYNGGIEANGNTPLYFGSDRNNGGRYLNGTIDEAAIWNRALTDGTSGTPNEILQLYQRGASRIKFQVRACSTSPCNDSTDTWKDATGTANSNSISEITNTTKNGATVTLSGLTNRYFQYRAILESDSSTAIYQPELKQVVVGPTHYDSNVPSVYTVNGVTYYSLDSFSESSNASCAKYNLGVGSSAATATWYYWDSTKSSNCSSAGTGAWCAANGTFATANTTSEVQSNRAAFVTKFPGQSTVYVKALLSSSGTTACSIDNILMGVQQ